MMGIHQSLARSRRYEEAKRTRSRSVWYRLGLARKWETHWVMNGGYFFASLPVKTSGSFSFGPSSRLSIG